jgi:hypothetical protein
MLRALLLILLFTVGVRAESPADIYVDRRRDLQGQFATAQKAIYLNPAKATEADFAAMAKVNASIIKLKDDFLEFELGRYRSWYNRGYWNYGKSNYWDSGPGARRVLDKLSVQLEKIKALPIKDAGPFGRSDLNDTQKLLDAIREALLLDAELHQMVRQYLRR